jgi:hypothetical protein
VTTTFHYEADQPQYESTYEDADVQLRCGGFVAVAVGPECIPAKCGPLTWHELSPATGKRVLVGVGRCIAGTKFVSAIETREAIWASAMAGLTPIELAETCTGRADCMYALVDPTNGSVELGGVGRAAIALILEGHETRLVELAQSELGVGQFTSLELSPGSTLLLLTHDPSRRREIIAAAERALAVRSPQSDEVEALLKCCVELRRNGAMNRNDSIAVLHLERLSGSPIVPRPLKPSPKTGEIMLDNVLMSESTFRCELPPLQEPKDSTRRCRFRGTAPGHSTRTCHIPHFRGTRRFGGCGEHTL